MKTKLLSVIGMLIMLLGLLPGAAYAAPLAAQVVVPVIGTPPVMLVVTVNDGAGSQSLPHVSGDWVTYWDNSTGESIHFQNLDMGIPSDRTIPTPDGYNDSLDDIGGNRIVLTRGMGSGMSIQMTQINALGNPDSAVEVSPVTDSLRRRPAIGGDTIAYEDHSYDWTYLGSTEISLSSVSDPAAPAYRLTNDALVDWYPAVSPDGNAVVWLKAEVAYSSLIGDVWRVERIGGVWGVPEQLTNLDGKESHPDTNGPVTVYASGQDGSKDIRWSVKDESGAYVESVLDLPGEQRNPSIVGDYITFESNAAYGLQFDIYLYNLGNNRLHRLTDTSISEVLSDVSTGPGGLVRVVWARSKQVQPYDMDVYAMSFFIDTTAPAITPSMEGTLGANGWYTSDVALSWTVTDDDSPVGSTTGCDPVSISSDQAAAGYTCSADSDGGASSETVSIARDATKPVTAVTGVSEGASYELGSVPQAGCASTDNLSGMAAEATVALIGGDAQGVGNITATCSGALDVAGNPAEAAVVHYTVTNPASATYTFSGFFQPVDNPGEGPSYVFNSVKAGSAVPVKFSLAGDQGLQIFAPNYPASRPASCTSAELTNPIDETLTAGSSSLSYDALSDIYTYVWKTDKKWSGTCRALNVTLDDGTQHLAYFQFK